MLTIIEGLQPTPRDERDFSFGAAFGHAHPKDLPSEYFVADPLVIKDQGNTDMCAAYALTAVSEDQEGVPLDPFFTFAQIKGITGNPDAWGADLRSACKAGVLGFKPVASAALHTITQPATEEMREAAAVMAIPFADEAIARQYAKKSFFSVSGPFDTFDNMRSAMWIARTEKRSILTGCNWRESWTGAKDGIIDSAPNESSFGHALKAFGWMNDYMVLQLSNGKKIGSQGIFTASREAVNMAFNFGAFTFMDMPREDAEAAIKSSRKGIMSTFFSSIFRTCNTSRV